MTASEWDVQVLRDLGISAASEFASLDALVGRQMVAQWRQESSDVGLLVYRLRQAVKQQRVGQRTTLLEREERYGREVVAWLERNFPDLCDGGRGPHPAAIAAVIRLHSIHGKGSLTRREYGEWIRLFVAWWEERFSVFEAVEPQ